jgi:hypothetical protein
MGRKKERTPISINLEKSNEGKGPSFLEQNGAEALAAEIKRLRHLGIKASKKKPR